MLLLKLAQLRRRIDAGLLRDDPLRKLIVLRVDPGRFTLLVGVGERAWADRTRILRCDTLELVHGP